MIAFLRDEPGAEVLEEILNDPQSVCYAHAVNLCEVYYDFLRSEGESAAEAAIADLLAVGITPREDMDSDFWREVGRIKVNPGKLSLADSFLLALAQRMGAEIVTTDHHEFDRLLPLGLWTFQFIR
jgi:predicted nucleic acid-binding protein